MRETFRAVGTVEPGRGYGDAKTPRTHHAPVSRCFTGIAPAPSRSYNPRPGPARDPNRANLSTNHRSRS